MVSETKTLVKDFEQQYQDGLITQGEKYNKVVDAWARCGDRVADAMMKRISSKQKLDNGREKPINAIYMMAHSGARGSQAKIKKLAGMLGLMAKPSGENHGQTINPNLNAERVGRGKRREGGVDHGGGRQLK